VRAVGRFRIRGPLALRQLRRGQFKEALPESAPFEVSRYPLPNLRAVNFVVHGILGWGVASNLRLDTQAKGMAERLRSHACASPASLVDRGGPAARRSTLTAARSCAGGSACSVLTEGVNSQSMCLDAV